MLRSCNYNLEECTSSYMAIHDDGEKMATSISSFVPRIALLTISGCCLQFHYYDVVVCLCAILFFLSLGVLDYSDHGPGKDPFKSKAEKKLKETVSV